MGPEENLHPEQPTLDERKFYEGEPHLAQGVGQFFRPLHMLVPFDVRLSYLTSNSSQGKQVLKGQMSYPNTGAPAECSAVVKVCALMSASLVCCGVCCACWFGTASALEKSLGSNPQRFLFGRTWGTQPYV